MQEPEQNVSTKAGRHPYAYPAEFDWHRGSVWNFDQAKLPSPPTKTAFFSSMVSPASSPAASPALRSSGQALRARDPTDRDQAAKLESKVPTVPAQAASLSPGEVIVVDECDDGNDSVAPAASPQRSSARLAATASRKPAKRVPSRSGGAAAVGANATPKKRKTTKSSQRKKSTRSESASAPQANASIPPATPTRSSRSVGPSDNGAAPSGPAVSRNQTPRRSIVLLDKCPSSTEIVSASTLPSLIWRHTSQRLHASHRHHQGNLTLRPMRPTYHAGRRST